MKSNLQFVTYAAKMRQHIADRTDLEVDARFIDMLARGGSTILDIGCGHGSAVKEKELGFNLRKNFRVSVTNGVL